MARKIQTTLGLTEAAKTKLDLLAAKRGLSNNELIEQLVLAASGEKQQIPLLKNQFGSIESRMLFEVNEKDGTIINIELVDRSDDVWCELTGAAWKIEQKDQLIEHLQGLARLYFADFHNIEESHRKAVKTLDRKVDKIKEKWGIND